MPRFGLPALRIRPRAENDDWFPLVAKVAVVLVVVGLVVGFLLVSGGGDEADDAVTNPSVPTITDSPGARPSEAPQPARPAVTVAEPAVGTQTAVITPKTTSKVKPRPKPRPGIDPRFARRGLPCTVEGAFAVGRRLEPLICRDGRWDQAF
jgi:hypothetical protein